MADVGTMLIFAVLEVCLHWLLQPCSGKPWFLPINRSKILTAIPKHFNSKLFSMHTYFHMVKNTIDIPVIGTRIYFKHAYYIVERS
jgi:hypothetical protein